MKKLLPNIFFLFLSAPVLSPQIGGITVYLYALVAVLDINYWKWICSKFKEEEIVLFFACIGLIAIFGLSAMIFFKMFMLAITVTYCCYCYMARLFYLYRYAVVGISVAAAQFILLLMNPGLSVLIGPTAIARFVWGGYATESLTNFYAVSILPRVSGLCREGGFFASYLLATFLILYFDKSFDKRKKTLFSLFFIAGFTMSLSKSTIILLLIPIAFFFKRIVNKFNIVFTGFFIIIFASIVFSLIDQNFAVFRNAENESVIHRFSGYAFIRHCHLKDFLIGVDYTSFMKRTGTQLRDDSFDFCGFPNIYLKYGIVPFFLFLGFMKILKFTSFSIVLIFLLTVNVSPWTCDNFVVLAWFLCVCVENRSHLSRRIRDRALKSRIKISAVKIRIAEVITSR